MFALDLFNTKYEKELSEGAVDNLQARRIDDLNMKMLDLLDRVKGANPKMRDGLKREFQKVKAERDGYFKINPATGMNASGTLGTTKGKLDEQHDSPVAGAITRRILMQRHDLLKQYGPELVGAAIDNVADYVGDVEEIGSSDVSAWVAQVERMLKENPPEAFQLDEYIVRSGDDIMSVMSLNLFNDLLGDANLSDYDEEFANSPKWQAVVANWAPKAEYLQREIAKYQNTGRKLRDTEADALDATAYDGSDAYENANIAASYLPKVYAKQAAAIVRLLKDGYANPNSTMHEASRSVDMATQDQLDHDDAMAARAFDRNQGRIQRQQGNLAAGVDVGRWLKPYQMLVKNNFEPVETKDRFEYLMQVALKLKGTNAGFSGDTGMSHAARIFGLQFQEQKLVANLIRNCPKISDLENYSNNTVDEGIDQKFPEPRPATPEEIKRGYVYSKSHHLANDGMVYYFKDPRGYSKQPTKTVNEGEKDYAYHRAKERHHEKEGDKAMARANSFGAHAHPTGIASRKKAEHIMLKPINIVLPGRN